MSGDFQNSDFARLIESKVRKAVADASEPPPTRTDLERVENKIDKLSEAIGELGRIEERQLAMQARQMEIDRRLSDHIGATHKLMLDLDKLVSEKVENAVSIAKKAHARIDQWKNFAYGGFSVATLLGGGVVWIVEKILDHYFK